MTARIRVAALAGTLALVPALGAQAPAIAATGASPMEAPYTFADVRSYPFPNELVAAPTGARIAWAFNEQGRRNVWVAEGPAFTARQLTRHAHDDGQEITSLALSPDGSRVVFVRGGEHGSNWDDEVTVNPLGMPQPPDVAIWSVGFAGGEPVRLGEGAGPVISPTGDAVAFTRGGQIWTVPIDGSAPPKRLFAQRGSNGSPTFSPDGSRLAFVSSRGTHAFVGVYENDSTPILWIDPGTARDGSPRWSPDGARIAFVRRPASGDPADSVLVARHQPWGVWTADARTGAARRLWQAPRTPRGSPPATHGGTNLHYAAGGRVVFASYVSGQPQLYSVADAATAGEPVPLAPGRHMVEHVMLSPDRRHVLFSANAGDAPEDIDRRHVVRAAVDRTAPEILTPGTGIEWAPVVTGDGRTIAYLSATAQRPPLPTVMPAAGGAARLLAEDRIPDAFPTQHLVTPRQVTYEAADGVTVHAQLFVREGGDAGAAAGKRPAIVFIHGGPSRQMLLGWHYGDYYANTYALNQYLAAKGYAVLSVNYRLGIGYGYEFQRPPNAGAQGAAEYLDVKAGAEWLARQPFVDSSRIGAWGGSYGGFLVAMGLARDSELFAAGVDLHGVHDWTTESARGLMNRDRWETPPDLERALALRWTSSPIADMATWRSPVLVVHGDDDRNVRFSQSVDLVRRLEAHGVPYEEMVIVDDTHHWMLHANALRVGEATADFFDRTIGRAGRGARAAAR